MNKKHFAVYRDGELLVRAKTLKSANRVVKDFRNTGKEFKIKPETVITPWLYAKSNGDFGYTSNLI